MRNYLTITFAVVALFVMIVLESKEIVKMDLSEKGQKMDKVGVQVAHFIENEFVGRNGTFASHDGTENATFKSMK